MSRDNFMSSTTGKPTRYHQFVRWTGPISLFIVIFDIGFWSYYKSSSLYSPYSNIYEKLIVITCLAAFIMSIFSLIKYRSNPFKTAKILGLIAFMLSLYEIISVVLLWILANLLYID